MSGYNGGTQNKGVDWEYFNKFRAIDEKYLPDRGQGDTMATQIVTATTKLVYKWYNDGDVYDNTGAMHGWCNDLSSYANWLYTYVPVTRTILDRIKDCHNDGEYEHILKDLVDITNDEGFLFPHTLVPAAGDIYECDGPFVFEDYTEDDEDYDEEEEY